MDADLLTPRDVSRRLGISASKVYAVKESIGYVALGRNIRFEPDAVQAYIDRCKRSPSEGENQQWASPSAIVRPAKGGSSQRRMDPTEIKRRLEQRRKQGGTQRSAEH